MSPHSIEHAPDEPASGRTHPACGAGVDTLLPLVYDELRALAGAVLRRSHLPDTTGSTSLVNDVYLRLINRGLKFNDKSHFLCLAARAMRMVLIDRARGRLAEKRGGGRAAASLDEQIVLATPDADILAIDEAMSRLATIDERACRVVELRFFGGLSVDETAVALGISTATVKREWALARAWLFAEITGTSADTHASPDRNGGNRESS